MLCTWWALWTREEKSYTLSRLSMYISIIYVLVLCFVDSIYNFQNFSISYHTNRKVIIRKIVFSSFYFPLSCHDRKSYLVIISLNYDIFFLTFILNYHLWLKQIFMKRWTVTSLLFCTLKTASSTEIWCHKNLIEWSHYFNILAIFHIFSYKSLQY